MEWPRGVNFPDAGGGDPLCTLLYIEQTDHVQFGSRSKGYTYERFPIKSGRHQPHRSDCTGEGPTSIYVIVVTLCCTPLKSESTLSTAHNYGVHDTLSTRLLLHVLLRNLL